jgi:predicted alpha/beta hydrolase family esterase
MTDRRAITTLFVPGLRGHVADHWQTHMAAQFPGSVTVEPLAENGLSREARVAALDSALQAISGDVVIVAHSAGVLMTAFWDMAPTRPILGALLVAPADVETPLPEGYPAFGELAAGGWLPIPRSRLSFPATVVASRNDPLAAFDRTGSLAEAWGAHLHDAGEVGHLNPAAGYGPWPEGLALWERLISRVG